MYTLMFFKITLIFNTYNVYHLKLVRTPSNILLRGFKIIFLFLYAPFT